MTANATNTAKKTAALELEKKKRRRAWFALVLIVLVIVAAGFAIFCAGRILFSANPRFQLRELRIDGAGYWKEHQDELVRKIELKMGTNLFLLDMKQLRDKVKELLDKAREVGAIIYYDVNFRSTHAHEAIKLMPTILENFEYADIVRGSTEDFGNMFGLTDADKIYQHKVGFYCPRFICTNGGEGLCLRTKTVKKDYPVEPLKTVSTIGAGDNFNAGLVFGLLKNRIRKADLDELTEADWDKIVASGMSFSREVCASLDNYISKEFAASL